ncbi:hypothetical protein JXM83_07035 [Candidatus Woesearchaeota archaeon]|nr:hypothetical protein [Candidatus Woesearchaeota archaeon]
MEREFISERQAAMLIGIMPKTLLNWRKKGAISKDVYTEKQYYNIARVTYNKEKFMEWYSHKENLQKSA